MSEKITDIDLMMHVDGELSADEAATVAAHADSSASARAVVQALGEVGETVRTYLELETDAAEQLPRFASMWSTIDARIAAPQESRESVRAARSSASRPQERGGFLAAVREWFSGWHGHVASGALAAAAVAVVMWVARPTERVVERTAVRGGSAEPVNAVPVRLESQPPEVESLEVYEGSGMILTIPDEEGDGSTAVIWISEEDDVEGPI